jgi:hypothetical protein
MRPGNHARPLLFYVNLKKRSGKGPFDAYDEQMHPTPIFWSHSPLSIGVLLRRSAEQSEWPIRVLCDLS